jgi:hypothetical protein
MGVKKKELARVEIDDTLILLNKETLERKRGPLYKREDTSVLKGFTLTAAVS